MRSLISFRTLILPLLLLAAAACTSVDQTEWCVETRYGKVVNEHMTSGVNGTGFNDVTCFSMTDQNYPAGSGEKETMDAQTKDPVTVQGDVAIVYAYDPGTIVKVFNEKRTPEAVEVEVQNAIREGYRSALAAWTVTDIFSERRAYLADSVKAHIQRKLGHRATIKNVFVRSISVPPAIEQARTAAAQQEQVLDKAKKQQAIAEANAAAAIAEAKGESEATRLRASAYEQNPKVLELEIAKALSGLCGQAQTCVIGASPNALLGIK